MNNFTRKAEEYQENLESALSYCQADFEAVFRDAEAAAGSSRQVAVLRNLANMLDEVGAEDIRYGCSLEEYRTVYNGLSLPKTRRDIMRNALTTMYRMHTQFATPKMFMERIVNRIDPDTQLSASLELRILRRFLTTVHVRQLSSFFSSSKSYYSETLERQVNDRGVDSVGEEYFDVLKGSPRGCDYLNLVEGCFNLAHGISIDAGTTKGLLFLFAFAYGMRYYTSTKQEGYSEAHDVTKNLFTDYYCDNLTRFLHLDKGSGVSDLEPSGIVINPKNFVDALFVYYLNRTDLTTQERISSFCDLVSKIKAQRIPNPPDATWALTNVYRDRLIEIQTKCDRPECEGQDSELETYVKNNYRCDFCSLKDTQDSAYMKEKTCDGTFILNHESLRKFISVNTLMDDHICLLDVCGHKVLLAIEASKPGAANHKHPRRNALADMDPPIIGNEFFVYNSEKNAYLVREDTPWKQYYSLEKGRYCLKKSILDLITRKMLLEDHICLVSMGDRAMILAIEVMDKENTREYAPVRCNQLKETVFGSEFFTFDPKANAYKVSSKALSSCKQIYTQDGAFFFFNNQVSKLSLSSAPTTGVQKSAETESTKFTVTAKFGLRFLSTVKASSPTEPAEVHPLDAPREISAGTETSPEARVLQDTSVIGREYFQYDFAEKRFVVDPQRDWSECYKKNKNVFTYTDPCFNLLVSNLTMEDHICIMEFGGKKLLYAIETVSGKNRDAYGEVNSNRLGSDVLGSEFFTYDSETRTYSLKPDYRTSQYIYSKAKDLYFFGGDLYGTLTQSRILTDNILLGQIQDHRIILAINAPVQTTSRAFAPTLNNQLVPDLYGSIFFDYDATRKAYVTSTDADKSYRLVDRSHYVRFEDNELHDSTPFPVEPDSSCLLWRGDTPLLLEVETKAKKETNSNNTVFNLEDESRTSCHLFSFMNREKRYKLTRKYSSKKENGLYRLSVESFSQQRILCPAWSISPDGQLRMSSDADRTKLALHDHICIVEIDDKRILAAIEVKTDSNKETYGRVMYNRLDPLILGSENFVYDPISKSYQRAQPTFKIQYLDTSGVMELKRPINTAYNKYLSVLSLVSKGLGLPMDLHFPTAYSYLDGRLTLSADQIASYADPTRLYELDGNLPDIPTVLSFLSPSSDAALDEMTAEQKTEFSSILEAIVKKLTPKEALCVTDPVKVTRTKIIAAYYHQYLLCEHSFSSFRELYDDFCDQLNEMLIDAGYNPVSSKNLFDMVVVILAYCMVNNYSELRPLDSSLTGQ